MFIAVSYIEKEEHKLQYLMVLRKKKKKGISGLTWWKQVISLSKETQGSKGKKKKKKLIRL